MNAASACCLLLWAGVACAGDHSRAVPGGSSANDDKERIRTQLISRHDVAISSQVEGKIVQLPFKEGDAFKSGQLLVGFDCQLHAAQLQKAEAAAEGAGKTYDISKRLGALKSVGELEVEQAKARAKEAAAEVAYIRGIVQRCSITAPFAGRIAQRLAAQYEYVTVGKPLLQIVDVGNLELKLIVPSKWLVWLRVGAALQVQIEDLDARYAATVVRLGGRIDPVSQTLEVSARIQGAHPELLPGMSGWARFDTPP